MELIDQKTKALMEECKIRARKSGLDFSNETLEYIATNRDLIRLSPKVMIPTLYDYWVNDVEILKEEGKYKLYPTNPYETVINSRPAISFYNDNNPDWMNIMIFYHVLGHIDFFQNNIFFSKTRDDDFVGQALSDKRLIENLRSEHGRWVDYIIEFSRSVDNITGFYNELPKPEVPEKVKLSEKLRFYFNDFLQQILHLNEYEIFREIERYNQIRSGNTPEDEMAFFNELKNSHPEFEAVYEKTVHDQNKPADILQFIVENSPFLKKEKNSWMLSVIAIVRSTSLYFAPQIRTKIINEGWASYWHDELFRQDDRISGHEVDYAKLNAGVTSINRIGLNPYAIGLRLIQYAEELADKGKMDYLFQKISDSGQRDLFDQKTGKGKKMIFDIRKNFSDFMLINTFVDQDFVDKHDLFVVGKRLNQEKGVIEYYIKSRKAEDYKQMLIDSLYHPPFIEINTGLTNDSNLYLLHRFEGKQLYKEFIPEVLVGMEYLWGGQVQLETTEIIPETEPDGYEAEQKFRYEKVLYSMNEKKVTKVRLG